MITQNFLHLANLYTIYAQTTYPIDRIRLTFSDLTTTELNTSIYENGETYCIWQASYTNTTSFPQTIIKLELLCSHPNYSVLSTEEVDILLNPNDTLNIYWRINFNLLSVLINTYFLAQMKENFRISRTSVNLTHIKAYLQYDNNAHIFTNSATLKIEAETSAEWETLIRNNIASGTLTKTQSLNLQNDLLVIEKSHNISWDLGITKKIICDISWQAGDRQITYPSPNQVNIMEEILADGDYVIEDYLLNLEFENTTQENQELNLTIPEVILNFENTIQENGEVNLIPGITISFGNTTQEEGSLNALPSLNLEFGNTTQEEGSLNALPSLNLAFNNEVIENQELNLLPSLNLVFNNEVIENQELNLLPSLNLTFNNEVIENGELDIDFKKSIFIDGYRKKKFDKGFYKGERKKWLR